MLSLQQLQVVKSEAMPWIYVLIILLISPGVLCLSNSIMIYKHDIQKIPAFQAGIFSLYRFELSNSIH